MSQYAIDFDKIVNAKPGHNECSFCGRYRANCMRNGSLKLAHLRKQPECTFTHNLGLNGVVCEECFANNGSSLEAWRKRRDSMAWRTVRSECISMNEILGSCVTAAELIAALQELPPGALVTFRYECADEGTQYTTPELHHSPRKVGGIEFYELNQ